MKTLLIVSFHFPPSGKVGGFRPWRFARYLPAHGWRVVVLSAQTDQGDPAPGWDPQVLAGTRVERTRAFLPGRASWVRSVRGGNDFPPGDARDGAEGRPPSALYRGLRWIKDVTVIPDEHVGWFPFAVRRGLAMIRRENPDLILATDPPHSALMVGAALSRLTGRPWVADLRDPWIADPFRRPRPRARENVERWLEGRLLSSAARILVTTDSLAGWLARHHADLDPQGIQTVRHGYDPELFEGLTYRPTDRFRIVHTGTFYGTRAAVPFLEGLRGFLDRVGPERSAVRVDLVGGFDPENRDRTLRALCRLHLEDVVSLSGRTGHAESVRRMVESDVLIYVLAPRAEGDLIVPAKTWEYIASGRPILGLVPEGAEATRILARFGRGPLVSPPDDVEGVARALAGLYQRWREGGLASDPPGPEFEAFSAPRQVAEAARALDAAVGVEAAEGKDG